MCNDRLYKYLDADGGLMMLYYGTLMFTNATQLNDPFDCHPALINVKNVPRGKSKNWPPEVISFLQSDRFRRYREKSYICSLSKVCDSLLMWSYYNKHQGVCIGLDMAKTRKYCSRMSGMILGCQEWEVQYRNVVEKPDFYNDLADYFHYQMSTKAKAWEHEQEVRLFAYEPSPEHMRLLPGQYKEKDFCEKIKHFFHKKRNEDTTIPWEEVRAFFDIGGECFESVYLGVNLNKKKNAESREKIITVARKRNPNIKIYQMTIDPEAFRLKEEMIRI